MNKAMIAWIGAVTFMISSALGQGFVNLDFESAQIIPVATNGLDVFIAATDALPGWSAFGGTNQLSTVVYNPSPGSGEQIYVGLYGSNSYVLSGNFSVVFAGGHNSISQTGLVPAGAESMLFEAYFVSGLSSLSVSLDGQNLTYVAISTFPRYTLYGADISPFAGQVETLTFSGGGVNLDDIQFSSSPIPEPGGLALLALGGGALIYTRVRLVIGNFIPAWRTKKSQVSRTSLVGLTPCPLNRGKYAQRLIPSARALTEMF